MYQSSFLAQDSGSGGSSLGLLFFLIIPVAMYFLMIRPQQKRQKELKAMMDALAKGDEVVTSGGLLGRVVKVADGYVTVEIAEGTEVVIQKGAITTLLPKGTVKAL